MKTEFNVVTFEGCNYFHAIEGERHLLVNRIDPLGPEGEGGTIEIAPPGQPAFKSRKIGWTTGHGCAFGVMFDKRSPIPSTLREQFADNGPDFFTENLHASGLPTGSCLRLELPQQRRTFFEDFALAMGGEPGQEMLRIDAELKSKAQSGEAAPFVLFNIGHEKRARIENGNFDGPKAPEN